MPAVTLIMANHNGQRFIKESLKTVIEQTFQSWEALVIDDASTDGSRDIVAAMAARDPRIRLLPLAANGGPAAARNVGFDVARGRWAAVMDSDDLIHPERLARLLHQAETYGCDIAADNMLVFDEDPAVAPYAFLTHWAAPRTINLAQYIIDSADGRGARKLGYLKPMFRTAFVRHSGVRYPTALRIGEDFSFVRALLAAGARFDVFPELTYFYRKHAASVSHRLSPAASRAMLADDARFLATQPGLPAAAVRAASRRRRGLQTALAFDALVGAIKARRWAVAGKLAAGHTRAALMLRQPAAAWVRRRLRALRRVVRQAAPAIGIITPHKRPSAAVQALRAVLPANAGIRVVHLRQRSGRAMGPEWTIREAVRMARQTRRCTGIIVADGPDALDALPYLLRPDRLTLAVVDQPATAAGLAKLACADALLTRPDHAAALRAGCPDTPLVLLPEGRMVGPPGPPSQALADFLGTVWPRTR